MVCYGVKRKLWYQWFDMWVVYVIEKKKFMIEKISMYME